MSYFDTVQRVDIWETNHRVETNVRRWYLEAIRDHGVLKCFLDDARHGLIVSTEVGHTPRGSVDFVKEVGVPKQ